MEQRAHWHEGAVEAARAHIQISWEPKAGDLDGLVVVARVAPGDGPSDFLVQFVIDPNDPRANEAIADVRGELDFYLVEMDEPDPWAYARYHCTTASNIYGQVHWSWRKP
jgi:hypothetical protein